MRILLATMLIICLAFIASCSRVDNPVKPENNTLRVYTAEETQEVADAISEWQENNNAKIALYRPIFPIAVENKETGNEIVKEMADDYGITSYIVKIEDNKFFVICLVGSFELVD